MNTTSTCEDTGKTAATVLACFVVIDDNIAIFVL